MHIDDDVTSINSPLRIALEKVKPEDEFVVKRKIQLTDIEDETPCNPIDYYDNDDGFWNEWIKKKNAKLPKVPL